MRGESSRQQAAAPLASAAASQTKERWMRECVPLLGTLRDELNCYQTIYSVCGLVPCRFAIFTKEWTAAPLRSVWPILQYEVQRSRPRLIDGAQIE